MYSILKKCFFVILFITSICYAKSKTNTKPPLWMTDINEVYPDSKYIARIGNGASLEEAEINAQGKLAGYFENTIQTSSTANSSMTETNGTVTSERQIKNETTVSSNVKLFSIHFSDAFYDKKEKTYYCVAYLDRNEIWNQIQPKLESAKQTFESLYTVIQNEPEPFLKIKRINECRKSVDELTENLNFARFIVSEKEAGYKQTREKISNLSVIYNDELLKCKVYIDCPDDYNKILSTTFAKIFNRKNISIVKKADEANYIAKIEIDDCIIGEEPYAIQPVVTLKILGTQKQTVYSQDFSAEEKTLAYTIDNARKKAYPKLAEKIENETGDVK